MEEARCRQPVVNQAIKEAEVRLPSSAHPPPQSALRGTCEFTHWGTRENVKEYKPVAAIGKKLVIYMSTSFQAIV